MKNYLTLMGVFLKDNFSLRKMLGSSASKSKGKMVMVVFAIIYAVGVFLGTFGWMFYQLGLGLQAAGLTELLLMFLFSYAAGFAIMISLLRVDGYLFHFKDYEILAPLPMKPASIIAAKASVMMINMYLMMFIFALPIVFSYIYFTPVGVMTIIYLVLGYLLAPLPLIIIASLISMGIARITVRLKKSNLVKLILLFVVFLGIMVLSFTMNFAGENPLSGQQDFIRSLGDIYLPMQWFVEAVHEQNFLSFVLLLVTHAGLFGLFIFAISKASMKINSKHAVNIGTNHVKAVSQSRSVFKSLLVKEIRNYFGMTMYVFNTLFGTIIMLLVAIASLFFKNKVLEFIGSEMGMALPLEPMLLIIIGFCLGMIYTSAVSLSIEGKKFPFLKSLPIHPNTIMKVKLFFNILLGLPAAIISIILLAIAFEITFINVILMMFLAASFSALISSFGSILNLYMPKFDFINEIEVVKQSLPALIAVFGAFGFLAMNGGLYYLVSKEATIGITMLSLTLFNGVIASAFYLWMTKKSESLFMKMIA
jgi:ABC-2 type transport system permease protein